jgi:hypothetical protein
MTHRPVSSVALLAVLALIGCASSQPKSVNTLASPTPGLVAVDREVIITDLNLTLDSPVVKRAGTREGWPRIGTWTGPEIAPPNAFTEFLPSFNVLTPPDTGATLEFRFKSAATGEWSDFLYLGQVGRTQHKPTRLTAIPGFAKVEIDLVTFTTPATAFQARVRLESYNFDKAISPTLRQLSAVSSLMVPENALPATANAATPQAPATPPVIDIPVPFRGAMPLPEVLRSECCSPLSTSMVMAYQGIDKPVEENSLAIYDREYDLFGNWGRAVSYAGSLGLNARLTRFRSWDKVYPVIAAGQPLVITIRFKKGEFPSNILPSTEGHLIVLRGFDENGNAIVNDPASTAKGNRVIYNREELGRAWFGAGGVAYIISR